MRMSHHKSMPESFPSTNSQALDLISFAFVLTCTLLYIAFALFKITTRLVSYIKSAHTPRKEEYQLTSTSSNEEENAEQLMKEKDDILRQLLRLKRYLHVFSFLSFVVLACGLYLGVRSINYGVSYHN